MGRPKKLNSDAKPDEITTATVTKIGRVKRSLRPTISNKNNLLRNDDCNTNYAPLPSKVTKIIKSNHRKTGSAKQQQQETNKLYLTPLQCAQRNLDTQSAEQQLRQGNKLRMTRTKVKKSSVCKSKDLASSGVQSLPLTRHCADGKIPQSLSRLTNKNLHEVGLELGDHCEKGWTGRCVVRRDAVEGPSARPKPTRKRSGKLRFKIMSTPLKGKPKHDSCGSNSLVNGSGTCHKAVDKTNVQLRQVMESCLVKHVDFKPIIPESEDCRSVSTRSRSRDRRGQGRDHPSAVSSIFTESEDGTDETAYVCKVRSLILGGRKNIASRCIQLADRWYRKGCVQRRKRALFLEQRGVQIYGQAQQSCEESSQTSDINISGQCKTSGEITLQNSNDRQNCLTSSWSDQQALSGENGDEVTDDELQQMWCQTERTTYDLSWPSSPGDHVSNKEIKRAGTPHHSRDAFAAYDILGSAVNVEEDKTGIDVEAGSREMASDCEPADNMAMLDYNNASEFKTLSPFTSYIAAVSMSSCSSILPGNLCSSNGEGGRESGCVASKSVQTLANNILASGGSTSSSAGNSGVGLDDKSSQKLKEEFNERLNNYISLLLSGATSCEDTRSLQECILASGIIDGRAGLTDASLLRKDKSCSSEEDWVHNCRQGASAESKRVCGKNNPPLSKPANEECGRVKISKISRGRPPTDRRSRSLPQMCERSPKFLALVSIVPTEETCEYSKSSKGALPMNTRRSRSGTNGHEVASDVSPRMALPTSKPPPWNAGSPVKSQKSPGDTRPRGESLSNVMQHYKTLEISPYYREVSDIASSVTGSDGGSNPAPEEQNARSRSLDEMRDGPTAQRLYLACNGSGYYELLRKLSTDSDTPQQISPRVAQRNSPREAQRNSPREAQRNSSREAQRNSSREAQRNSPTESNLPARGPLPQSMASSMVDADLKRYNAVMSRCRALLADRLKDIESSNEAGQMEGSDGGGLANKSGGVSGEQKASNLAYTVLGKTPSGPEGLTHEERALSLAYAVLKQTVSDSTSQDRAEQCKDILSSLKTFNADQPWAWPTPWYLGDSGIARHKGPPTADLQPMGCARKGSPCQSSVEFNQGIDLAKATDPLCLNMTVLGKEASIRRAASLDAIDRQKVTFDSHDPCNRDSSCKGLVDTTANTEDKKEGETVSALDLTLLCRKKSRDKVVCKKSSKQKGKLRKVSSRVAKQGKAPKFHMIARIICNKATDNARSAPGEWTTLPITTREEEQTKKKATSSYTKRRMSPPARSRSNLSWRTVDTDMTHMTLSPDVASCALDKTKIKTKTGLSIRGDAPRSTILSMGRKSRSTKRNEMKKSRPEDPSEKEYKLVRLLGCDEDEAKTEEEKKEYSGTHDEDHEAASPPVPGAEVDKVGICSPKVSPDKPKSFSRTRKVSPKKSLSLAKKKTQKNWELITDPRSQSNSGAVKDVLSARSTKCVLVSPQHKLFKSPRKSSSGSTAVGNTAEGKLESSPKNQSLTKSCSGTNFENGSPNEKYSDRQKRFRESSGVMTVGTNKTEYNNTPPKKKERPAPTAGEVFQPIVDSPTDKSDSTLASLGADMGGVCMEEESLARRRKAFELYKETHPQERLQNVTHVSGSLLRKCGSLAIALLIQYIVQSYT